MIVLALPRAWNSFELYCAADIDGLSANTRKSCYKDDPL